MHVKYIFFLECVVVRYGKKLRQREVARSKSSQERSLHLAAALSTAAPSFLAAPQFLHQSSPHHVAAAGQACISKGQACSHGSEEWRGDGWNAGGVAGTVEASEHDYSE
eukprot:1157076-Pelagomonas_calceolata.AAC.1